MANFSLDIFKRIGHLCQASYEGQIQSGKDSLNLCANALLESTDEIIIEQVLWTLIHINRRVILDKSTTCKENQNLCKDHIKTLVTNLDAHINSSNLVYPACVLMMILASDNSDNQSALGEAGATKSVINILQLYENDQTILEYALRCVRNFSANDEVAGKLTEDGIGERLQNILTSSPSHSVAVLEAATWAVVNLSYDEDIAALLGSVGCCSAVLSAYPGGTSVSSNGQIAFCWAVRNLSCPSLNIGSFAKSNVASLILDIINKSADDYELLNSAIWCINNLSCSITLLKSFLELNAAEILVSKCRHCMATLSDDIELGPIAEATVFTLRNLSCRVPAENSPEESSPSSSSTVNPVVVEVAENVNQTRLGGLGSLELVRDILLKYIEREGMVENCFNTLSAMCRDHAVNQSRAGEIDLFFSIFAAIAQHKHVLDTVETGLKLLIVLLASHPTNVQLVCEQNGVALVVEYMKHHRTDYDVCSASCELLYLLHYRDEQSRAELKEKNQISDDGLHARPAGRFEDIAIAWKIDELVVTKA